jgi:hypothetical protein
MRYVLMVLMLCLSALVAAQNTQSPDQIRQRMAEIRRTTNWDDPAAAKKANEQIRDLAKQLMAGANMQSGPGAPSGTGTGAQGPAQGLAINRARQPLMTLRTWRRSTRIWLSRE